MKLHSIVSKALQKSSCTRIPGIFCISFTIIFSSSCSSPRLSSEFYRTIQFSNCLVVCHYHDFSPKQIRSSEPFFNTLDLFFLYDGFIMSKTNQIRGLYFHFIKRQQIRVICNLVAAVQLVKQTAQLSGVQKTS